MNVVAEMLLTDPAPAAIWATLLLLTFPALLLLGSPDGTRHPRQAARQWVAALREHGEQRRRRAAEAVQAARFADEVAVAADRAADSARRWQQHWERCEDEVSAAWQTWLDADARVRRALAVTAFGTPQARTCPEYAAREHHLHRAVAGAVDRGELPADALADALAGRHGWDPRLHPAAQDLVIARASAAWLRHRYEQAVAAERTARHDAELARRAGGSLRHEADVALARAAGLSAAGLSESLPAPVTTRASTGYVTVPAT